MRQVQDNRTGRARGLTLIEVMISIAVVAAVVLAAMMVRYHAVRHAVRADAYATAARIGQLLLEGSRSTELFDTTGQPVYEPYDRLVGQFPIGALQQSGVGPDVTADGFTLYSSPLGVDHYHVTLDNMHFYATLGYIDSTAGGEVESLYTIQAAVAFMADYGLWDATGTINTVRLMSIK